MPEPRRRRPASAPPDVYAPRVAPPVPLPPLAPSYIDWVEVRRRTTLSRTTIWRLERQGQFPKHINLSPGRIAWKASDVEAWMAAREREAGVVGE